MLARRSEVGSTAKCVGGNILQDTRCRMRGTKLFLEGSHATAMRQVRRGHGGQAWQTEEYSLNGRGGVKRCYQKEQVSGTEQKEERGRSHEAEKGVVIKNFVDKYSGRGGQRGG